MEMFPEWRLILTSYEATFAATWGRAVRDIIEDSENQELLSVRIRPDARSTDGWLTTAGGGMTTAGVGGPITGKGANVLIIDDPVKNAAEANSPTISESIWEWWRSTARTRLEPGGVAIVIMTRWHTADLAGRLIAQSEEETGETWEQVIFPAIAEESDVLGREPGQALWPSRYNEVAMKTLEESVGPYVWSALYQQNPRLRTGGMFQRGWFDSVEYYPPNLRMVRYWDMAATEDKKGRDPDYTVGVKMGMLDDEYWILDVVRLRGTPADVERAVLATASVDGPEIPIRVEQEPGASGKTTIFNYQRVLKGYDVRGVPTMVNKIVRAAPLSARAQVRRVHLLHAAWNTPFLDEIEAFPFGPHDDQVDGATGAHWSLTNGMGDMDVAPIDLEVLSKWNV